MDEAERDEPESSNSEPSSSFAFVNITHPDQSKDSRVLKTVRQKAMRYYLTQSGSGEPGEAQSSRLSPYRRSIFDGSMETPSASRRVRRAISAPEDDDAFPESTPSVTETNSSSSRSRKSSRSSTAMGLRSIRPHITPDVASPSGRYGPADSDGGHLQRLKYNWNIFFGSEELESSWQRPGSEDPLFNYSAICISARHTDAQKQNINSFESAAIYNEVTNSLNQRLQFSEQTTDLTIAIIVHLCFSELYTPEPQVDWCDYLRHLVELRGGVHTLDFSWSGLSRVVLIVSLLSAITYESSPIDMFYSAALETLSDPNYTQALESPLCHPDGGFAQIMTDSQGPQRLVELLDCVRRAIDIAGAPSTDSTLRWHDIQQQKREIRGQLLEFKALPKTKTKGQEKELAHIFEACRLSFIILERALFYSQSLSQAVTGASEDLDLLYRLQTELVHTDLDSCWRDLAGVLLWVSLVGASAANGIQSQGEQASNLRAWLVGCAVRTTLKYTFKYPAEILTSLCTFLRVQEVCAPEQSGA